MAENNVSTASSAYNEMNEKWKLVFDLLGGTTAMRKALTTWLPQMGGESQANYIKRVKQSFLFNGYRDAVRKLVSRPFSRSVTLHNAEGMSDVLWSVVDDVDMTGKCLTALGREMMHDGINTGVDHVLVDYPQMTGLETRAEERDSKVRPLLIHVPAENLIGWRLGVNMYGQQELLQIRIKEEVTEPAGDYGDKVVQYIRVIEPNLWQRWRYETAEDATQGTWILDSEGQYTLGYIPLLTWYTYRTGHLTGEPPLDDLAWTNLAHWQSYSDQRHILQFARVGIIFGSGMTDDDLDADGGKLTIGPNRVITSSNEKADLKYVEHTGKAIGAGRDDLTDLQDRMELLGLMPLVQRTGNVTATERAINEARSSNDLQAWCKDLESTLTKAMRIAGEWRGEELHDEFAVDIYSDWGISDRAATEIQEIINLTLARKLSMQTCLSELQRRGVIDEMVDVEEEIARIQDEPIELVSMGMNDDGDEGNAEN